MIIRLNKLFLFLFVYVSLTIACSAQNKYYTKSKKAIKQFESAIYQYHLGNFIIAKADLENALKIDENFIDAYILLGEISNEENQKENAIGYYNRAIAIKNDYNPLAYLRLAEIQKSIGKYADARLGFQRFLEFKKYEKEYKLYASDKIEQCNFAIEMMKHPVDFHPINLGAYINTPISEYWPSLTADDSILVFTSSNRDLRSQEDLYFSDNMNKKWSKAQKIAPPVNSAGNEGAQTISADGRTIVFTACSRPDGYGNCDLYISIKKGNNWTKPVNMGNHINSQFKESQPSLSSDGKTIYFVSNRPDGKGKFDIWKSTLNHEGTWKIPSNLGDSINTAEDELAPFIHYDSQTLYFSSEGHLGMGGSDLFISSLDENGNWCKAKNAGYPINTFYNEESLIVNAGGAFGMFSSNMDGGFGQKDIYQFELPMELKPHKTLFVKGLVYDAKTNLPLQAELGISNILNESELKTETDPENGEFLLCLAPQMEYAFNINKTGYLFFSEYFFVSDSNIYLKIPLQPIEIGQSAILKNIFFEYDSYMLKKESFPELQKLINFINNNKVFIEIQGHTDNTGTQSYNKQLSENRAKSVYNYLINNGIEKKYLTYKGYGFDKPIASNKTNDGKAKNRRTSFLITGKT